MATAKLSNSPILTAEQSAQFASRLEIYRAGVEKKHADHWKDGHYDHNPGSFAIVEDGKRYVKVKLLERMWRDQRDHSKGEVNRDDLQRTQIHSFIDKLTGDVLKPATWRAPTKNARGNIFDDSNGLARVNHYGPEYLK